MCDSVAGCARELSVNEAELNEIAATAFEHQVGIGPEPTLYPNVWSFGDPDDRESRLSLTPEDGLRVVFTITGECLPFFGASTFRVHAVATTVLPSGDEITIPFEDLVRAALYFLKAELLGRKATYPESWVRA